MSLQFEREAPAHPRDWDEGGIDAYLRKHTIVCKKVTPLTGGVSSWVWRLDGLRADQSIGSDNQSGHLKGEPVILKCADGMAKLGPVPLSAERLQLEVKALKSWAVAEATRQEPSVQVPRVLKETYRGYMMTWGGDVDLRVAYKNGQLRDAAKIGASLGKWLACLHLAGIDCDKEGFKSHNPDMDVFVAPGGLEELAVRKAMGNNGNGEEEIAKVLEHLRAPPRVRTMTVWDFRPMNTLLRIPAMTTSIWEQQQQQQQQPDITIVDWEFTHHGDPAYDLRLWAAEAMVLEAKFGEDDQLGRRGLLEAFLKAYRQHAGVFIVDVEFTCKVAVAMGTFILLLMPAQVWDCDESETALWTKIALDYIKAGVEQDMIWLERSSLKPLLDT
ncbi:hypothetical protein F5883DRAFT_412431 [Diaporthe sp. PMI_573]|nr:hypothetical protein F5883DRAFT_412431 [Diaporthaceae sp. PMI_573]